MKYISTKEAAEKWNVTARLVRYWCQIGKIEGAIPTNSGWKIPENAPRANDERKSKNRKIKKSIDRGYLYLNPTYCDGKRDSQYTKYDKKFCEIINLYLSGQVEEAEEEIKSFINYCDKDYLLISYVHLRLISQDLGNKQQLKQCEQNIEKIVKENLYPYSNILINMHLGNKYSLIELNVTREYIPVFYFEKSLSDLIFDAKRFQNIDLINPDVCELGTYLYYDYNMPALCLYNHCILADFYSTFQDSKSISFHQEKAYEIAKQYNWFYVLSQYSLMQDWSFLKNIDLEAYNEIEKYSEKLIENYIKADMFPDMFIEYKTHNVDVIKTAFLIAQGKSNREIEKILDVTTYKARKYIYEVHKITGLETRDEIKGMLIKMLQSI